MTTQSRTARQLDDHRRQIAWDDASPLSVAVSTERGELRLRHGRFVGGAADGVEVVELDSGVARTLVLPTRGMAIWAIEAAGVRFSWESPVHGPVHPSRVPLFDPSGLGWLEGFDELVARCGLESNGAPEFDDQGRLAYPLHGRVGNLAADGLRVEFDEASGRLELIGEVYESRLFFKRLRLRSRLRIHAGRPQIELLDDVTNELSTPATMQLLYHINLGSPILGDGAVLEAPIAELAPKDARSAAEIDHWNRFGPPESGYAERVYFARLHADESDQTAAMIRSEDASRGFAVRFQSAGLPRFVLWKNTAAETDGYVAGLEPATNFPNPRSYEAQQGRVVELGPGETASFRLSLHPLLDATAVSEMSAWIDKLTEEGEAEIHRQPRPGWSP